MGTVLAFSKPAAPANRRNELLRYCELVTFPAEQRVDAEFGVATLDKAGHELLKAMFSFFGVTELDPSGGDFDTVLNTWFVLSAKVGEDIRARAQFFDTVYAHDAPRWSSDYRNYVEALWAGDDTAIRSCADSLNIRQGIPEGAPSLRRGPLPA